MFWDILWTIVMSMKESEEAEEKDLSIKQKGLLKLWSQKKKKTLEPKDMF